MSKRVIDLSKKNMRLGETRVMNNGLKATIIDYRKASDIDVMFLDDNCIRYNVRYNHFIEGKVDKIKQRVGEIYKLKCGATARIIEYRGVKDVDIKILENEEIIRNLQYNNIKEGSVRPRYYPSVYSIGYLGESSIYENGKISLSYQKWNSMIERCYAGRHDAYKDVAVCEEWHNYSNFKKWFDENYYKVDDEQMDIDKDILSEKSKIYSPNTCLIIPHYLNVLILDNKQSESQYGTGISKKGNKYIARVSKKGKRVCVGAYSSLHDAKQSYMESKTKYIKEIIELYKSKIPNKVYVSLLNYKLK